MVSTPQHQEIPEAEKPSEEIITEPSVEKVTIRKILFMNIFGKTHYLINICVLLLQAQSEGQVDGETAIASPPQETGNAEEAKSEEKKLETPQGF